MTDRRPRTNRRTVLGTLGTGTVLALAGCVGGDGSDDGEDEESDGTDDGGDTDGTDETEQFDQPAEFPEGEECAVCNMIAAEHPDWNAQLVHESGSRTYFCSSGCMAAYYPDPLEFGDEETPVDSVWVTGYESGELMDASQAHFVRVTDSGHVDDIMMMNPTPFEDVADAEAFVSEFDEYGEEDIIGLEDFDTDLAMLYRSRFFEEGENDN